MGSAERSPPKTAIRDFKYLQTDSRFMLVDFDSIDEVRIDGMNGGEGSVYARMDMGPEGRFILCRIAPGASIGSHVQKGSVDINYVVSGTGHAVCNGVTEQLKPGVCHVCPPGGEHSIINDGDSNLVLFTAVRYLE